MPAGRHGRNRQSRCALATASLRQRAGLRVERLIERSQVEEYGLAVVLVDPIVVCRDVHGSIGAHGQALDLVRPGDAGGVEIWRDVAQERLLEDRQRLAVRGERHGCGIDGVDALDHGLLTDLVVALDDGEATVGQRGDLREAHPPATGRLDRVERIPRERPLAARDVVAAELDPAFDVVGPLALDDDVDDLVAGRLGAGDGSPLEPAAGSARDERLGQRHAVDDGAVGVGPDDEVRSRAALVDAAFGREPEAALRSGRDAFEVEVTGELIDRRWSRRSLSAR